MNLLPFIIWWFSLPLIYKLSLSRQGDKILSIYIYILISGRLPLPFISSGELWIVYGLIFIPLALAKFVKTNPAISNAYITPVIFLLSSIFYSSLAKKSYNDGYILLALEQVSLIVYLLLTNNVDKSVIKKTIVNSLLTSVICISCIGLLVQLLIILGLDSCPSYQIYHPLSDIHCVPFLGSAIYRFSIGSNINEYSLYIGICILVLLKNINSNQSPSHKNTMQKIYLIILFIAGLLSLSRALFISLALGLLIWLVKHIVVIPLASLNLQKDALRNFLIIFLLSIGSILLFSYILPVNIFQDSDIMNISERFSFLSSTENLFKGESSEDRLYSLSGVGTMIESFSILPLLSLGEGTFLHNTFLQFQLELGFLNVIPAALAVLLSFKNNVYLSTMLIVYMGVHHILYNPILIISWYLISIKNISPNRSIPTFS